MRPSSGGIPDLDPVCLHPRSKLPDKIDVVTGQAVIGSQLPCKWARGFEAGIEGNDWCGPDGRFWEPTGFGP